MKLTGSGKIDTLFARLLGQTTISFTASTEVVWGIKKLNLALVLDNTGSMAQSGKMTNLKTAAHNLLTTLQNAAKTPGDVQVAIVPFATDVNVGTGYVNANWIDWTDWEAANGTCSKSSYTTKSTCTSAGKAWTPKSHSTWNGCVYDRDQNNDVSNTAPVPGSPATMFRADQAANCPVAMMPLGYDWTALNSKVDAMTPTGNTNVTIGLAWGFQLLSPVAPFNAPPPADDLEKVIVILTDGTNTQNRWSSTESVIDARTSKACDQHQGRQHPALHGARHRRQRVAAARLRHQAHHVLRRAAGGSAQQRVLVDRAEPRQPAHHAVDGAPAVMVAKLLTRRSARFRQLLRQILTT